MYKLIALISVAGLLSACGEDPKVTEAKEQLAVALAKQTKDLNDKDCALKKSSFLTEDEKIQITKKCVHKSSFVESTRKGFF